MLILPGHPVHMLFLGYWLMLGAASSHSGYEAIWARDRQALQLGAFFHQQHHRYYEGNYGNAEMPWDKWFGTYHDGSEEATKRTRNRKREMHAAGKWLEKKKTETPAGPHSWVNTPGGRPVRPYCPPLPILCNFQ